MTQQQFFERVLETLTSLEIPYMVAGSVGAMIHGEPRMTNDMDVVIELASSQADALEAAFPLPEFYVTPADVMRRAIERRSMFNVLHVGSGSKVDLIVRKDTAHGVHEFGRRRLEPFTETFDCYVASPEDVIVAKLRYYREGGSEKHLRDIRGMIRLSSDRLDWEYLTRWVRELELTREWLEARRDGLS